MKKHKEIKLFDLLEFTYSLDRNDIVTNEFYIVMEMKELKNKNKEDYNCILLNISSFNTITLYRSYIENYDGPFSSLGIFR